MTKQLNHTIVRVRDKRESATFLTEILGLDAPGSFGPFAVVELDNGVSLDFADDRGAGQQPQRRRPGRLLGGPKRRLPRDHHPPVRQRRLSEINVVD
jgi:catechol 2,3-dioxygenase-like lactoylglutathione lyase family enzyme